MAIIFAWLTYFGSFYLPTTLAAAAILVAISYASFTVLKHANALARALGEPFGTVVLTLSIVIIEVAMVVSVLLGPGDHGAIARDAAFSATMLLLNLLLAAGIAIALARGSRPLNRAGTARYLLMIATLGLATFVLPKYVTISGFAAAGLGVIMALSYAFFMWRQLGASAGAFQDDVVQVASSTTLRPWRDLAWLVGNLVPIVVLADALSPHLNRLIPNTALTGLLLAAIVLLPETLTTFYAAWHGQLQRVSNLTHGALVSVVGASIPAVLLIAGITGAQNELGANYPELVLLAATLLIQLSLLYRVTIWAALGSFAIFGGYLIQLFAAA